MSDADEQDLFQGRRGGGSSGSGAPAAAAGAMPPPVAGGSNRRKKRRKPALQVAALPHTMPHKSLRACLQCKLIKTEEQFRDGGCENCTDFGNVRDWSTPTFHGTIAMLVPGESWVARWQRQDKRVAGMYAVEVTGELQDEMMEGGF